MSDELVAAAVGAALHGDWKRAQEINKDILKECPDDVDCLNRLGKAYLELGNYQTAATIFRKVLKLSKYNQIALKNLARISQVKGNKKKARKELRSPTPALNPANFLEEPGKTKLVALVNVAPASSLLKQNSGDPVLLTTRRHTVQAVSQQGYYLGALPDDIGRRLAVLIKGGNSYDGLIKSVSQKEITVLLRELSRAKKFRNTPSFLGSILDYVSSVREEATAPEPAQPKSTDTEEEEGEGTHALERLHQDEEEEPNA